MTTPPNRVRARREALGMAQLALAERARLSRQSVGAIEAGRAMPAVDVALRLARALDCRVEDLFGEAGPSPWVVAEWQGVVSANPQATRVAMARVGDAWVALPLVDDGHRVSADGIVVARDGGTVHVEPMRELDRARENVVMMGCASGLGLIADRLGTARGAGRFLWFPTSSAAALDALARGRAHVAGVHRVDDTRGDANVREVRKAASREALTLVTLARWEAGLLLRADDERRIRGVADLVAPRVRIVAREPGAGARHLLERSLARAGAPASLAKGAGLVAHGHLDVARAIAMGAADVGVATRDAAIAFGLRFVPLAEERYDLVFPSSLRDDPRMARLLDVLVARSTRRELGALGYDVTDTGAHVAEVRAA